MLWGDIKVLIVDDNKELTNLLKDYIKRQENMDVVGVAYNGRNV